MRNSPLARVLLLTALVVVFFLLQADISFADVVADAASKDPTFADKIDKQFGTIVGLIAPILFEWSKKEEQKEEKRQKRETNKKEEPTAQ